MVAMSVPDRTPGLPGRLGVLQAALPVLESLAQQVACRAGAGAEAATLA
jgi:hypothetical protein